MGVDDAVVANWIAGLALLLSIVNSIALLVLGARRRRARLSAGPIEQVREKVTLARTLLEDALGDGGRTQEWYHQNDIRDLETDLGDLESRVGDRQLRDLISDLVGHLSSARLASPEGPGPRVYGGPNNEIDTAYAAEDRDIATRTAATVSSLTAAHAAAARALDRLNVLERRLH
jgi:hypothetical protein